VNFHAFPVAAFGRVTCVARFVLSCLLLTRSLGHGLLTRRGPIPIQRSRERAGCARSWDRSYGDQFPVVHREGRDKLFSHCVPYPVVSPQPPPSRKP